MDNDLEDLISIFAKTTDEVQMRKLFEEVFTPSERKDFALRWNLMKDLYRGIPQREIAANHGISLCRSPEAPRYSSRKAPIAEGSSAIVMTTTFVFELHGAQ